LRASSHVAATARRPAKKRFGQHFLEPAWIEKVIHAIAPQADETFLEIGPGRGALTLPLAARAKAVIACEVDRDLAADLRDTAPPNVTIVEGDFLEASDLGLPTSTMRVAGNLPYNVASPIMFKLADLFEAGLPFTDATLMLQREVAERLIAAPGGRQYGVLSVLLQHVAEVRMILKLPAGAFRPPPKVLSSLVQLRFHDADPAVPDREAFAAIVRSVFSRRRKTLSNALRALQPGPAPAAVLALAELDGRRRPETLSVAEFARLAIAWGAAR